MRGSGRVKINAAGGAKTIKADVLAIMDWGQDGTDHNTPERQVIAAQSSAILNRVMIERLSPREERVLRLRFGLGDDGPATLDEVGAQYGVHRERIRQIEAKAIRALKGPRAAKILREAFGIARPAERIIARPAAAPAPQKPPELDGYRAMALSEAAKPHGPHMVVPASLLRELEVEGLIARTGFLVWEITDRGRSELARFNGMTR